MVVHVDLGEPLGELDQIASARKRVPLTHVDEAKEVSHLRTQDREGVL